MSVGAPDDSLFPGALAPFRTHLVWSPDQVTPALTCADLEVVLARFQRSVDGPCQPTCSLWAQLYFNTLLIPATCLLAHEVSWIDRAIAIGSTFCHISGRPLRCTAQGSGGWSGEGSRHLARHLDTVIDQINDIGRLSKRLLRESADRTIAWTLNEISHTHAALAKAAFVRFLEHGFCSSGWRIDNITAVRQFCCLRDRIPDGASCPDICPREQKRTSYQAD